MTDQPKRNRWLIRLRASVITAYCCFMGVVWWMMFGATNVVVIAQEFGAFPGDVKFAIVAGAVASALIGAAVGVTIEWWICYSERRR